MRAKLTGLHKATKRLANGQISVYAYACRGGPLLAKAAGRTHADANRKLEAELGLPATLERLREAREPLVVNESKAYVRGLVSAFLGSPEFARLKPSTAGEYRRHLDAFREEFGDWKVSLFEKPAAKIDLLEWRDEWADRPRTADYVIGTVGRLFSWARGRGLTCARPTDDIERLHKSDRSDLIWTPEDLSKLYEVASPALAQAVKLAVETGLRQGDLLRLGWSNVQDDAIVLITSKRGRQAVIPLTAAARAVVAEAPKVATVVLTSSRGRPWTSDGFKTMFRKAKDEAGITGLRFHDLRGTAATRLYQAGLDKRDIALVLGWSEGQVDALLNRYVSGTAVAQDMLRRMRRERA